MLEYILFAVGIFLLVRGADYLIEGSSSLAKKFKVPTLIIGLTIVALGTSLPELVINILAALKGNGNIIFGNIIGSNVANILLILGITSIIAKLGVQRSTVWREIPFSILAVIILLTFVVMKSYNKLNLNSIFIFEGVTLLLFFCVFIYYIFRLLKRNKSQMKDVKLEIEKLSSTKIFFYILGGFVALYFGGKWTVDGAVALARLIGMSEYFISLTIVSLGTSLPELFTSIIAITKKNVDLAVGNIVGSNILNIFWILGVSSLIAPIAIPAFAVVDLSLLLGITFLLFLFMFVGRKYELRRWKGIVFVSLYLIYILYLIMRSV